MRRGPIADGGSMKLAVLAEPHDFQSTIWKRPFRQRSRAWVWFGQCHIRSLMNLPQVGLSSCCPTIPHRPCRFRCSFKADAGVTPMCGPSSKRQNGTCKDHPGNSIRQSTKYRTAPSSCTIGRRSCWSGCIRSSRTLDGVDHFMQGDGVAEAGRRARACTDVVRDQGIDARDIACDRVVRPAVIG